MGEAARRRKLYSDRPRNVGGHYVLIIEWLGPDERHTGAELALRINESYGAEAILASCQTIIDVMSALDAALERLANHGQFPLVHFESHGEQPSGNESSRGMIGPQGELLTWKSLAPQLAEMNRAAGFRLVVVGAACYGLATLNMFEVQSVAPFTMVIGFESSVKPGRLFEAMCELYSQLFRNGQQDIYEAVNSANRELRRSDGELLVMTTAYGFAQRIVRQYFLSEFEPSRFEANAERLNVRCLARGIRTGGLDHFRGMYRDKVVAYVQASVRTWFAMDEMEDTAVRFPIRVAEIARNIERRYRGGM